MIFGKIDYLNLLPFHIFIKRYMRNSRLNTTINFKRGIPSEVNLAFKKRRIDAAFVSSVETRKYKSVNLGIVARRDVLSVLLIPGETHIADRASATSNVLAQTLGLTGQVLIGDAALKYQLEHDDGIDLAKLWYEKYNLPFVFAKLCYHKKSSYVKKLSKNFLHKPIPIPYYLLKRASDKTGISMKDIRHYLTKISYEIDPHAKKSLHKFLKKT